MSFFEGLKKVIQGKPVYEVSSSGQSQVKVDDDNISQKPIKVYVEDTDSRLNGDRLETYCRIKNDSDVIILLDKMRILNGATEIDDTLKPGESKQVRIYSGDAPKDDNLHDAELQYRTEAGEYYKARHDVRFKAEDEYYTIERIPYENTSRI